MQQRLVILLFVVSTLSLAPPLSVSSEDATTSPQTATSTPSTELPPLPLPQDVRERKEARKVELRNRVAPGIKNRTANLLENVTNRLDATALRLERISLRVLSRIEKHEKAGASGTAAREAVARAEVSIKAARSGLVRITDLRMERIVDSSTPRKDFTALALELRGVRDELMNARTHLGSALTLLSIPEERTATTTTP